MNPYKIVGFLIIGMNVALASPLLADSPDTSGNDQTQDLAHLKRDEKSLKKMQDDRSLDNEHTHQAQDEYNRGTVEMSGHDKQQGQDVQQLKSVESQITAGKKRKESRQAMNPLLQNRRTLKENIHDGNRLVHNEKTVLSVQKRIMDSDARYRAADDRKIQKEEKNIADDHKAITQNVQASELSSSK